MELLAVDKDVKEEIILTLRNYDYNIIVVGVL